MYALMDTKEVDNFEWVDWMISERESLDMSQADLARAAELTRTTISDYELRQRPNPDIRALVKISVALGHSPLLLPRKAGLIPPDMKVDQRIEDIVSQAQGMSDADLAEILSYIRWKNNQRKK